jgi:hypothetical protein
MRKWHLWAQEYGGQKLHLVEDFGHGRVADKALCGRRPKKRGRWRMTINVPLGKGCLRCLAVWLAGNREHKGELQSK